MNIAKRIISLIIFLALFAVSALRINTVLNYQDDVHSRAEFSQFYSLPSDILDAVWIGSSSVQEFAIAPVMYKENGIALYPMAFGNLPFNATRFLITEIEKTQDPEVYLVDIRQLAYNCIWEESIRRVTDNMAWSDNKVKAIQTMTSDWERYYNKNEIALNEFYFSFYKYHNRWNDLSEADFVEDKNSFLGYFVKYGVSPFNYKEIKARFDAPEIPISEETQHYLSDFLNFCDALGKKVIFTCTPNCLSEDKFAMYNYAKRIITNRGYEMWDLNLEAESIGLDYSMDFIDPMHTNNCGAEKVSKYVADKLQQQFGFANHQGDNKYHVYEEMFEKYSRKSKEVRLSKTTNFDEYLFKLKELNGYTAILSVRDIQGYSLTQEQADLLKALGFDNADTLLEHEYHSFVGVIDGKTVVAQNIGNGDNGDGNTEYHGMLNDMNISVTSQTLHAGDKSSINVSGKEYSKNMRGFNIVVVDNTTGGVIDSVSFDTHVPEFTCTR